MPVTSLRFFVVDFLNGNGMRQTFVKQRKREIGVLWPQQARLWLSKLGVDISIGWA